MSNSRIEELASKEKLVKMQDILSCFESGKQKLAGETSTRTKAMTGDLRFAFASSCFRLVLSTNKLFKCQCLIADLKSRSDILQKKIEGIRSGITSVENGQEEMAKGGV